MVRGVTNIVAALGLALSCTVAHAEKQHWTATPEGYAKHLSSVGAWEFSARKKGPDGRPECYEAWTFKADGSGSVVSGEQTVDIGWKYYRHEALGILLQITYQSSTPGKNCLGNEVNPDRYPRDNGNGIKLMFFREGTQAYVCNAPLVMVDENDEVRRYPDGSPMLMQTLENCWGDLRPRP